MTLFLEVLDDHAEDMSICGGVEIYPIIVPLWGYQVQK
jgi:hypothetical protein